MQRSAASLMRSLHGLFPVYKPPGFTWKNVRDTLQMKLLKELNSIKRCSSSQPLLFLPEGSEGSSGVELAKVVTCVASLPKEIPSLPSLVNHELVKGPAYNWLKIGVGHKLDRLSSGVLVFGIRDGAKLLSSMYENHYTRDYTVCGTFGKATADFTDGGKIIEKTTFNHITRDKLERIIAMIQGSNQKAMLTHSHIDLKSQEAYDLAVQGKLRPKVKTPPLILGMRCLEFSLPDFTLEIQCMHETQQHLRKTIHEIGLELRSTAVCTKVRRTRDGPFTLDSALTHVHWDVDSLCRAIKECKASVEEMYKENIDLFLQNAKAEELLTSDVRSQ
ncbi:pseudouridylate synthase TRUB2, mitochondrial [Hyperolius riggenbachi]|uniref:pseudouridylate synthase TRUB2, mitochondrial n=1 Tax=Hyperolius riggenbachi TaxID=752182 RepID=UPI0035A378E1